MSRVYAGRLVLLWAAVVVVLYSTHAVINVEELHRMHAGDFETMHAFWPLPSHELVLCRAAAVLGVVVLALGAVPPMRPTRVEPALLATVLPALALIPVLVGPLKLGHRLYGHETLRDDHLLAAVAVLDVLLALAAVVLAVVAVVTATSRKPLQT